MACGQTAVSFWKEEVPETGSVYAAARWDEGLSCSHVHLSPRRVQTPQTCPHQRDCVGLGFRV